MDRNKEYLIPLFGSIGFLLAIVPAFKSCTSLFDVDRLPKNSEPSGVPLALLEGIWVIISPFLSFIAILAAGAIFGSFIGYIILSSKNNTQSKNKKNISNLRNQKTTYSSTSAFVKLFPEKKKFQQNNTENIKKITEELRDIEKRIIKISNELDISFPVNYMSELMFSIENKDHNDPQVIQNIVNRITKQANDDLKNLIKSSALYLKVRDIIIKARTEMINIREHDIVKELHECSIELNSDSLKKYLESKNWIDYNSHLNDIIDYINEMLKSVSDDQSKKNSINEMNEEKAFEILNIPIGSTNDDIKKAYKYLVNIWHPDKQKSEDDEKMKLINEAYEYLKKTRNII